LEFILVDAEKGSRAPAFDHERLAAALTNLTGKAMKRGEWPFETIKFSEDEKSVRLIGAKKSWQCDLETYRLEEAHDTGKPDQAETGPRTPDRRRNRVRPAVSSKSPDEKWEVVVHEHNLFLRNVDSKEERALTRDATAKDSYVRDAQRDRAIEMEYETPDPDSEAPEVFWSPDSRRFVAMRTRPATERKVYLVESSPKYQVQPKLQSYPYQKPGDDIPIRMPHLFEVETNRETPIDHSLFPTPWSISELRWSRDSSRFTFLYNQRGHQVIRIVGVDATTAEARAIVEERSKTFIDYSGKSFSEQIDETGEIIWMSERDGWNHLYLYSAKNGEVKNQITKGEWVVRGVDRVEKEKRQIWFRAGGIHPGRDPYYVDYCRINFDGSGLIVLTEGDGTHSVQFSPDRRFMIDTWSRVDLPPMNELRRSDDGKLVCQLEQADLGSLAANGWRAPERFRYLRSYSSAQEL
jgi:dipeptidyl-peptidase-4